MVDIAHKNQIYDMLADAMISALENGEIEEKEAAESSQYILDHFPNLENKAALIVFLEELSHKWRVYTTVLVQVKSEEIFKDQKIQSLQTQLKDITYD